ncbi:MAG TPA: zf-HC2 domain-containing protein [Candidatus Angelobacter sp.]|nr:zf-HC2 domain-containing protein [Candidatus Angelobacter sp.]
MRCNQARRQFSSYIDGAVSGLEMRAISVHLQQCTACRDEYKQLENTRVLVSSLGRKHAPPELALRIRIRLSAENSRTWSQVISGHALALQYAFRSFMLPATAGMVTAAFFFAILIGFFVTPRVSADDVPTMLYTPPRLESSTYPENELNLDSPILIETYVDASGKVQNYRIISGRDDEQIREQLNRALLFTIFAPAQSFGRPVPGKAVISFSHINVGG